jgi:prepilin-type N-terminal cleavage/methylation domain-containing protein
MKRPSARPTRTRQQGFTLIEILVVIAIIGVIANIIVPAMIHQIVKARATHLVSEYKLLEHAVHSYNTDAGRSPSPWFSASEHPDLAPYLKGRIDYQQPGLGLSKFFVRYSDAVPSRALRFRSGYLLYSRQPSPLLQVVQDNFDGKVEVFWPGRLIVLVLESA